ncbi:MAG: hypothetical protein V4805_10005 [Pseudomonadota bacterium]
MTRRLIKWMLIFNLLLLMLAVWRSDALPPPLELHAALLEEPLQTSLQEAPFDVVSNEVAYTVQPLFDYELTGLIVSKHNADSWWDYIHREANDSLNITDLCVIWGNNARTGVYADFEFYNLQFTCNFQTNSHQAYAAFDQAAISNNHLLTADPRIAKLMRKVQVGDQIRFRGRLAEYSHNQGFAFKRGTSTVRNDTGNGACETVYVDSFEVIKSGNKLWRALVWVASIMLLLSVIAWFMQPVRYND